MPPPILARTAHSEEYEDLLSLWGDLESALSVLLARPAQVRSFQIKVRQLDQWLQDLAAHDIDAALYLMFQLAGTSSVGYSASHALVSRVRDLGVWEGRIDGRRLSDHNGVFVDLDF